MLSPQPGSGNHEGALARTSRGLAGRGRSTNTNPYGNGFGFHSGENLALRQRARRNQKTAKFIYTHANPNNIFRHGDFAGSQGPHMGPPPPRPAPPSVHHHHPPLGPAPRYPHQPPPPPTHPPHENLHEHAGAPMIPLGYGAMYMPETFPTSLITQPPYLDPQSLVGNYAPGPFEVAEDAPRGDGHGDGYNIYFPEDKIPSTNFQLAPQGAGHPHGLHRFDDGMPSPHPDMDDSGSFVRERPQPWWNNFES